MADQIHVYLDAEEAEIAGTALAELGQRWVQTAEGGDPAAPALAETRYQGVVLLNVSRTILSQVHLQAQG